MLAKVNKNLNKVAHGPAKNSMKQNYILFQLSLDYYTSLSLEFRLHSIRIVYLEQARAIWKCMYLSYLEVLVALN
jgi:hypothetical protein